MATESMTKSISRIEQLNREIMKLLGWEEIQPEKI